MEMENQQISPEQAKALQEKLKNMSPEELKEFQKKQCIFCKIISGEIPSKIVYDDTEIIAILDINPANPGHLLVMPKEHYQIMPQIPSELTKKIFITTKHLSNSILRALKAQGTTVFVANGVAAGQKAQHFMVHVIPRFENDDINLDIPEKKIDQSNLDEIKKRLKQKFSVGTKEAEFEEIKETHKKEKEVKEELEEEDSKERQEEIEEDSQEDEDLDRVADLLGGKA